MKDLELDELLLSAAPVTNAQVRAADLLAADEELMRSIGKPSGPFVRRRRRTGRRLVGGLAIGVALTVLMAALVIVRRPDAGGGGSTAYAEQIQQVAESAPRYLLPGWRIFYAGELTTERGEVVFTRPDGLHLSITWVADQSSVPAFAGRESLGTEPTIPFEVNGYPAELHQLPPMTRQACEEAENQDCAEFEPFNGLRGSFAWWKQGGHWMEIEGGFDDIDAFKSLLASIEQVDVATWLAALPESVVKPADRWESVQKMLDDIPLPPGFDTETLRNGDLVTPRARLAMEVTSAVGCDWMEIWVAATDAGDNAAASRALEAMGTSPGWAVLQELDRSGEAWPEQFWGYSKAMSEGQIKVGNSMADGPDTVRKHYRKALQCDPIGANGSYGPVPRLAPLPEGVLVPQP